VVNLQRVEMLDPLMKIFQVTCREVDRVVADGGCGGLGRPPQLDGDL
jgi:hypothetical protein